MKVLMKMDPVLWRKAEKGKLDPPKKSLDEHEPFEDRDKMMRIWWDSENF